MNHELLIKFTKWIEQQSINQLSSVSPIRLQNQLGITEIETVELVDELQKDRLLAYKYKFECKFCGEACEAYERALNKGPYLCESCGTLIIFDDIKQKCEVAYDIKKNEFLNIIREESVDYTQKALNGEVVNIETYKRKEDRNLSIQERRKIFFGSSSEAIEIMNGVAAIVGQEGFKTVCWNSPNSGVFLPTQNTIDNLLETAAEVDGAVFIFNADDKVWRSDKSEQRAVRDNVLFEYGLFMGKLGKNNVVLLSNNNPHIASDLSGVTYIDLNQDDAVWSQYIRAWLKKLD